MLENVLHLDKNAILSGDTYLGRYPQRPSRKKSENSVIRIGNPN